ncbi:hypothetical protein A6X21_01695 [Planctopirus hydrillae]|uniref:C-type lectin domain-containing protein n=1 Tax=Planctopirus hydrillae TaxID=1841610 RepID=A0A1C3EU80_9PLAN|nr:hypothetical protein A6X21_01695 [Planctopirus hydrillae]
MRWCFAPLVAITCVTAWGIQPTLEPVELDPFIQRAVQAHRKSVELAEKNADRELRDAFRKRKAAYDRRARELTQAGNLDQAVVIRRRMEDLASPINEPSKPFNGEFFALNGHRYAIFEEPLTWHFAKSLCEERGGHLAIINSDEELAFIDQICGGNACWLGASDEAKEGKWQWIDGSELKLKGRLIDNEMDAEHWLSRDSKLKMYNDLPSARKPCVCEWDY